MVEVYKTNVQESNHAMGLVSVLSQKFPLFKINFDIDDPDRILRVEGEHISSETIEVLMKENGFWCEALP